jgi:hypothetical protein
VLSLNTLHKYFALLFKASYFVYGVYGWLVLFLETICFLCWYGASLFAGSKWFMPFFSTYGVSFGPLGVGYRATKNCAAG